jgi:hypothetical protein
MGQEQGEQYDHLHGSEAIRHNAATNVLMIRAGEHFIVLAADGVVVRTRVEALAHAEFDEAVETLAAPFKSRLAKERAAGTYAALASENGAARSSKAQRGGKGGRGGV